MSISSINANLAAQSAALNIGIATQNVSNDTTALSSGNRIVNASTDVAALSIGTGLQSQVNILSTALTVASQGSSLLQVADGALAQIQSILQQQQSIATQAQAGSLSATQLGFLDQQFQALTQQVNSLAGSTNFNGVNLLNGSIAGGTTLTTNTSTGNASLPLLSTSHIAVINSGVFASGTTLTVNGYVLQLNSTATGNLSGTNATASAANVAAALNASGASQLADYRFSSNGVNVDAYYIGGSTANIPGFNVSTSAAAGVISSTNNAAFAGGTSIGTLTAAYQTAGNEVLKVNGVSLTTGTTFALGASLAATTTNLVNYLNSTSNAAWAGITFATNGTPGQVLAYYNGASSPAITFSDFTTPANITSPATNLSLNTQGNVGLGAGSFTAVGTPLGNSLFVQQTGSTAANFGQGVDLSSLNSNAAFLGSFGGTGTIGAISATYNAGGTPSVTFSVVVGNDTYTTSAINVSTLTGAAPTALTFNGKNTVSGATEGGSFTLNLQGGQTNITNQNGASQLASAINASLSNVSVYQNRTALSYNNNFTAQVGSTVTATLQGSSISFSNNNFSSALVSAVSVSAPSTGSTDAKITLTVGGQTYTTSSGIGNLLQTDTVITLVNTGNPSQTITLTTGNISNAGVAGTGGTAIDLSSSANAAAFQTALSNALGISSTNAALSFQVGSSSNNTIGVSIASSTSSALFGGASLDVKTQADAVTAGNVVQTALNTVGAIRAGVGSLESEFNFAQAAIQSAVQNEGAAKSNLLDTNVATASTEFATHQVQLQAGIAVLAQANQLQQNLLKLIA